MKETSLGEFQEIVLLTILILEDNAYGVSIQQEIATRLEKEVSRGSLHTALMRLEEKGFIQSEFGAASAVRGGRRKRFFVLTNTGKEALKRAKDIRDQLWKAIPNFSLKIV